jgi:hypothetical protein
MSEQQNLRLVQRFYAVQLFAATSPKVAPSGYCGPKNMSEMKGLVTEAKIAPQAKDQAVAARLWDISEQLTSVHF